MFINFCWIFLQNYSSVFLLPPLIQVPMIQTWNMMVFSQLISWIPSLSTPVHRHHSNWNIFKILLLFHFLDQNSCIGFLSPERCSPQSHPIASPAERPPTAFSPKHCSSELMGRVTFSFVPSSNMECFYCSLLNSSWSASTLTSFFTNQRVSV